MVKISIIAPVYGVEKYIHQFLESIEGQSFKDIEVILVDDGSPDNCPKILDAFAKKDSRYKVIHQKNGGVSDARNTGLAEITGKYVYIIDSDDWLAEKALEELWIEAERTSADIIYGDYFTVTKDGQQLVHAFDEPFFTDKKSEIKTLCYSVLNNGAVLSTSCPEFKHIRDIGGAPWRAMIKASVITKSKLRYDTDLRNLGEDIMFMQHVLDQTDSVAYIQKPIYHYRMREESLSHGFKENLLDIYQIIFQKEEQYLSQSQKDSEYWSYYYFRIVRYINQSMNYYFQNKDYNISEKKRFQEFCMLMDQEPYHTAVKGIPLNIIVQKKTKVAVLLLRYKFYSVYWFLSKIKKYNFGSKERGKAK